MNPDWVCSFCGQAAALQPCTELRVCVPCAKRIARLAADTKPESVPGIWSLVAPPLGRVQPQRVDHGEVDIDRVFVEFKKGVAEHIAADDAESHSHLAQAYREMGLYVDALREAAISVTAAVVPASTEGPLGFLLTPPLLLPDGLVRLRERLKVKA